MNAVPRVGIIVQQRSRRPSGAAFDFHVHWVSVISRFLHALRRNVVVFKHLALVKLVPAPVIGAVQMFGVAVHEVVLGRSILDVILVRAPQAARRLDVVVLASGIVEVPDEIVVLVAIQQPPNSVSFSNV
jgi:hypothetical protein